MEVHLEVLIERHVAMPQLSMDLPQTVHERAVLTDAITMLVSDAEEKGASQSARSQIWRAARQLGNIRKMVELLAATEGDLFRIEQRSWGYGLKTFRPLAHRLQLMLATIDPRTAQLFPLCELDPFVELFLQSFGRLLDEPLEAEYASFEHAQNVAQQLNRGVQMVRENVRSGAFRRKLDHLRRSIEKNAKSLSGYIDALFSVYSKLLVIRVDLTYKNAGKVSDPEIARQEVSRAIADRESLFQKLKQPPFNDHVVGYAWKLEYGLYRGPHIHVLLFLDGQKVRQDGSYAKSAGDLWVELTKGRGDYYNCNAHKDRYGSALGIGMVDHGDAMKRARLQIAAGYLVERDYVRRLVMPDSYRTFGRGEMPSAHAVAQLGRPRRPRLVRTLP